MSNKTQLQTNNNALDGYIARVNAAKEVVATLPEAGSGGGGGNEDFDAFIAGTLTDINSGATKIASYAFYLRTELESAYFPNAESIAMYAFNGCSALRSATFEKATSVSTYAFRVCPALERVDFWNMTNIGNNVFLTDAALTAVIIRTNKVCTLTNKNAFGESGIANGTGFIYVPASLVDSYRSASNWSTYSSQIRAIEDYPEITGG